MNFLRNIFKKLFGKRREPTNLRYDAKLVYDEKTKREVLSPQAQTDRRRILTTELEEGDSYQLGPEATVFVGPRGKAGKAWITARVKANAEMRKRKFDAWWAEKRPYLIKVMMMTEQELRDSGIWDEVQNFLNEQEQFVAQAQAQGLLPPGPKQDPGPNLEQLSGKLSAHDHQVQADFKEMMADSTLKRLQDSGLADAEGRLVEPSPEALEQYQKMLVGGD